MVKFISPSGMGETLDLSGFDRTLGLIDPHPASVEVFTDAGSFFHILLGAVAGKIGGTWGLVISALFFGYELSKVATGETWPREGGKLIEFGLGLALGKGSAA